MRDTKQLHPELQVKIKQLMSLCEKNGIHIKIGECLRTVAEQDALYAKGRTKPGMRVTNAKGSTYSSMHQWGVAFDFFLDMDIDGDGSKADDAFNNATGMFQKVGKLGQSIGLIWGGGWKSIHDMPHFQLAHWGDTPSKLKAQYGTPDKFMATWSKKPHKTATEVDGNATGNKTPASKSSPIPARGKSDKFKGKFVTTANLNLRLAPKNGGVIITIPKGASVQCNGYYTKVENTHWLFVQYGKYTGYVSKVYLN